MATTTNVHEILVALEGHGQDMEREVGKEMLVLAQMAARTMQRLVPKHRSTLRQSIAIHKTGPMEYEIRPGVNYSWYVDQGVKPGGRGLPRFDPNSDIVQWLKSKAPSKFMGPQPIKRKRAPRAGSKAFKAAELELRDRYHGLIGHIRRRGVQAQPFVKPTARQMEPVVIERLNLAVRRVLAVRAGGGAP